MAEHSDSGWALGHAATGPDARYRRWPARPSRGPAWVVPSERMTLAESSESEEVERGEFASMGTSDFPVSRRGMIALVSLFGVSGCVGTFDDKVAKDPYISLIKQDPMFAWAPPGNLHREVSYSPAEPQPMASRWSVVDIVYSVPDSATIPSLVKLAQETSRSNGYNEAGKRDAGGINILLSVQASASTQGISLISWAPGS